MQITGHTKQLWITSVVSPLALLLIWLWPGYGLNVAVLIMTAGSMTANSLAAGVLQTQDRLVPRRLARHDCHVPAGARGVRARHAAHGLDAAAVRRCARVRAVHAVPAHRSAVQRPARSAPSSAWSVARGAVAARLRSAMSAAAHTRVLHLINGEFYAGAERVQDLLALQLGTLRLRRRVRLPQARHVRGTAPVQGRRRCTACRCGRGRTSRCAAGSPAWSRERRIQLLHTHTPRSALLGALVARLAGVPMVHHVHSPAADDTESRLRNARNMFVERLSLRGARRLIAVSSSLQRYLRERAYARDRICEMPERRADDRTARDCVTCRGRSSRSGTVALFRPRKGIEVLLDAMAHVREAGRAGAPARRRTFRDRRIRASVKDRTAGAGLGGGRDLDRLPLGHRRRVRRTCTCSCCRACSAKACRWSCWRPWQPGCPW